MLRLFLSLRFLMLFASAGAMLGALLMFWTGGAKLFHAYSVLFHVGQESVVGAHLMAATDSFLFGVVLLIFAYSIAFGFVFDLAEPDRLRLPGWMLIRGSWKVPRGLLFSSLPNREPAMIRWEHEGDGWVGFSSELPVAKVVKDVEAERESWIWQIHAMKRPNGWRKPVGHRLTSLNARRSAEEYWAKWLAATALQPDVAQLARGSLALETKKKPRSIRRPGRG
jgi:hypothetical protein